LNREIRGGYRVLIPFKITNEISIGNLTR